MPLKSKCYQLSSRRKMRRDLCRNDWCKFVANILPGTGLINSEPSTHLKAKVINRKLTHHLWQEVSSLLAHRLIASNYQMILIITINRNFNNLSSIWVFTQINLWSVCNELNFVCHPDEVRAGSYRSEIEIRRRLRIKTSRREHSVHKKSWITPFQCGPCGSWLWSFFSKQKRKATTDHTETTDFRNLL